MKRYKTTVLLVAVLVALAGGPALGLASPTADAESSADTAESSVMSTMQAQQDNATTQSDNATFDPVRIENETVSFAGVTVMVENSLASVERGTPTVWFKRVTVVEERRNKMWTVRNGMIALSNGATFAEHVGSVFRSMDQRELTNEATARHLLREGANVGAHVSIGSAEMESPTQRQVIEDVRFTRSIGDATGTAARDTGTVDFDRSTFTVSELDAPTNVSTNGSYNVSATVTNPGSANGTEEVQYRVNDRILSRQVVRLGPGESTTVTFQVSGSQLSVSQGTATHGVYAFENQQTGQLRVGNQTATNSSQLAGSVPAL